MIRLSERKPGKFSHAVLVAAALSIAGTGALGRQATSGEEAARPGAVRLGSAAIPPNTPDVVARKLARRNPRFTPRKHNDTRGPRTKFEEGAEQGPERVSAREDFERAARPKATSRHSKSRYQK